VEKFSPKETVCASQWNSSDISLHFHDNESRPQLLIGLETPCDKVILVQQLENMSQHLDLKSIFQSLFKNV
jgi:hypothetical protein